MSNNLQGKVIALTGGASGIGLETAKLLASRGALLSLADVQQTALEAVAKDIEKDDGRVVITVVDVRKHDQVDAWISKTVSELGKLDGAVNLAGVVGKDIALKTVAEIDNDDWDFVLSVNLTGVMNCMRAELQNIKDGGSIVNAASAAGIIGFKLQGAYSASKHGVIGLSRTAAKEFGHRGIRVNAIAPGPIDTPMVKGFEAQRGGEPHEFLSQVSMKRNGEPREVAELIAWLLCDGSSYVSGTVQAIDGGFVC